ncbi:hypothetical protein OHB26_02130 [Nocardia sp. NBC_01503]|uniref:DUF7373 family lipoprotein n=1 Tax=Nocardia sp. NBC_01503 TaxID=2975997 RepID=UPI002E7BB61D|nr:hypothetical protein [Nocardia sp. NBC_01503]WTL33076.1 hypothetical protein OHB26_02130 [Nocardia sp. NBC_01503]
MLRSSLPALTPGRRILAGVACFIVAILVAVLLWGARTVDGTPVSADISLSDLDFGEFGAETLTEPRNDKERYSRLIESARMSEAVADPREIDASLSPRMPALLPRPADTTGILADVASPILAKYGMLGGYSVVGCPPANCPTYNRPWSLRITALRLPDDAAARGAATEIEAADFAVSPENVAVTLPDYPAAQGHWRPTVPTLGITLAHGPFVVTIFVTFPNPDLGELSRLAAKAVSVELPTLDRFAPTPVADLPGLRFDRDDMLRRMVPTTRGAWSYPYITKLQPDTTAGEGYYIEASGVVFGPTGAAHALPGAAETAGIPADAIERVALIDRNWLIRVRDAPSARRLAAEESAYGRNQTPMADPAVPDTKCLRQEGILPVYYCVVQDGRYVAVVNATDEKSVHQRAAAQYALLVRNR